MATEQPVQPAAPELRIGDFEEAARIRREDARRASMSERLSRLNVLCRQMAAVRLRKDT